MKLKKILADYEQALSQLKAALTTPAASDLLKAGCIQYFEFCFELAWKSIKVASQNQGLPVRVSKRIVLATICAPKYVVNLCRKI